MARGGRNFRIVVVALVLLSLLAIAGASYQGIASRADAAAQRLLHRTGEPNSCPGGVARRLT
jgi:hypothetical protein